MVTFPLRKMVINGYLINYRWNASIGFGQEGILKQI